jgi:hypothetical protein
MTLTFSPLALSPAPSDEPGLTSNDLDQSDNIPEEPAPVEADTEDNEDDDKPVENGEAPDSCESPSFVERVVEGVSRVFDAIRETIWVALGKARRFLRGIFSCFATGA